MTLTGPAMLEQWFRKWTPAMDAELVAWLATVGTAAHAGSTATATPTGLQPAARRVGGTTLLDGGGGSGGGGGAGVGGGDAVGPLAPSGAAGGCSALSVWTLPYAAVPAVDRAACPALVAAGVTLREVKARVALLLLLNAHVCAAATVGVLAAPWDGVLLPLLPLAAVWMGGPAPIAAAATAATVAVATAASERRVGGCNPSHALTMAAHVRHAVPLLFSDVRAGVAARVLAVSFPREHVAVDSKRCEGGHGWVGRAGGKGEWEGRAGVDRFVRCESGVWGWDLRPPRRSPRCFPSPMPPPPPLPLPPLPCCHPRLRRRPHRPFAAPCRPHKGPRAGRRYSPSLAPCGDPPPPPPPTHGDGACV
jgi:hypothetical protein